VSIRRSHFSRIFQALEKNLGANVASATVLNVWRVEAIQGVDTAAGKIYEVLVDQVAANAGADQFQLVQITFAPGQSYPTYQAIGAPVATVTAGMTAMAAQGATLTLLASQPLQWNETEF
jgi:hypothetical protein